MTLRTEAPAGPGRGQQVEGADHVDLVEDPAADGGRVGLEEGVDDGVDLGRPDDAAEDRVLLVGADELGALERDLGLLGAESEDHLDVRLGLEGLGHAAAPEGVEPGDEYAATHGSAEPDAAALAQHVVEGVLHRGPDPLGLVHDPAPRVALEAGLHVEGDRVEDTQLELGREVGDVAERAEQERVGGDREVRAG